MDFAPVKRGVPGDPVIAVGPGTVIRADLVNDSSAGKWVGIEHDGGLVTRYMHLHTVSVKRGDQVVKGQQIGTMGATGADATHLHFDVKCPDSELSEYKTLFGEPVGGWGRRMAMGVGVPAEPLVPAETYASHTVTGAREHGIQLYSDASMATTRASIRSADDRPPWQQRVAGALAMGIGALLLYLSKGE